MTAFWIVLLIFCLLLAFPRTIVSRIAVLLWFVMIAGIVGAIIAAIH